MVPPENISDRNSPGWISGALTRLSRWMNAVNSTIAVTAQPSTPNEPTPHALSFAIASISAVRAGTRSNAPTQSSDALSDNRVLTGTTNQPIPAPKTANGTVTQKIQCQPRLLSSTPPSAGPALTPTAWAAANTPIA